MSNGRAWCLIGLALLFAPAAYGQSARITGVVSDPTGAVVPGVEVVLTNEQTGIQRTTAGNAAGVYSIPLLDPGTYSALFRSAGFQPLLRKGILLETGITRTVNATLELGAVEQEITVHAAVPLLESETSAVGQLIERQSVINMPLESRRTMSLIRLAGAVAYNVEGGGGEQLAYFSIAGGRGGNQMWLWDGTSAQNSAIGVPQGGINPPAEAIQEFKVEINNLSAEFGRTGGGFMTMTTRSGTNAFHGAAYEFLRNDALDARTFFAAGKAPLRYNVFGVSLGGPVKRDKSFFFFNWEGTRRRDGRTISDYDVPHPPEVNGDFSNRTDVNILDPLTRQPFPNKVIPQSRLDPMARKFAAFYPAPNIPDNNIRLAPRDNFRKNVSDTLDGGFYVARVDHSFNDNNRASVRFSANPFDEITRPVYPEEFADPRARRILNRFLGGSISWVRNLSPSKINEFRFMGSNQGRPEVVAAGTGSGKNGEFGLRGVDPSFFATVAPTGHTTVGTSGSQGRFLPLRLTIEVVDTLTWIKGNHQLKTGFQLRYSRFNDQDVGSAGGQFNFSDRATNSGMASFLLGWVTSASLTAKDPLRARMDSYAAFVQDDWKVTPKLTLNLGLRWEMDTPRWEFDNQQSGFAAEPINPVSGTRGIVVFAGQDGQSKYSHNFDRNNLAPRFGFAWRTAGDLVVRGGAGVVFTPSYQGQVGNVLAGGFGSTATFSSPDGGFTPAFALQQGMPAIPPGEARNSSFGAVRVGQSPRYSPSFIQAGKRTGYAFQYNLAVQKQLPGNGVLEASYLGNLGRKLSSGGYQWNVIPLADGRGPSRQDQTLRQFPQFSGLTVLEPDWGKSSYHALNVKVEKRYSQGLNLLMNYTFSKFLDNVEAGQEVGGGAGGGYQHFQLRHLDKSYSGNDLRHRYIVSSVYDLPFGKGRRVEIGNPALRQILGGWGLGAVMELRSGAPYGAIEQTNRSNAFSDSQRPNLLHDPSLPSNRSRAEYLSQYFDTSAFQAPGDGVFGSAPRTLCCGPGLIGIDASLHKWFNLSERLRLQWRTDVLNVINRPNFALPATNRGRADFGRISSIAGGSVGRLLQLSLRLEF